MKHFNVFDSATFSYVTHLKATNRLWFDALVNCAGKDPRTLRKLIKSACKILPYLGEPSRVNVFQICKAVNQGILTKESLTPYISDNAWHLTRELKLRDIKDRGWVTE